MEAILGSIVLIILIYAGWRVIKTVLKAIAWLFDSVDGRF